ncbi:hypothetical protein NM208_g8428 [Fusarium decemcellulare]|uniref:Uncharacterized protein n=1 Tax=Fusarium decemcellulare TaxID=57161 RepID=A0ACC1S5J0_9HYPO|nr:hypothetical protein NM208_g8428 [Fusarium decemcellulare]
MASTKASLTLEAVQKRQTRMNGHYRKIPRFCAKPVAELKWLFSDTTLEAFVRGVARFVKDCKAKGIGWLILHEAVQQGQAWRRQRDRRNASRDLDDLNSYDSTAPIAPGVHVVFCISRSMKTLLPTEGSLGSMSALMKGARWQTSQLTAERLEELGRLLGPGMCCNIGSNTVRQLKKGRSVVTVPVDDDHYYPNDAKEVYLHQLVLTMLWAQQTKHVLADYLHWVKVEAAETL